MKPRKERRRRRVYVTKNTEYHFHDDVCVAVKNRREGSWLLSHQVLSKRLSGSVRFRDNGDAYPSLETPDVGDALFFGSDERDVVTSVVARIDRPTKETIEEYPL